MSAQFPGLRLFGLRLSAAAATGLIAAGSSVAPVFASPGPSLDQLPAVPDGSPGAATPESGAAGSFGSVLSWPTAFAPVRAPVSAGDDIRAEQWHLKTLNVAGAWNHARGQGITVAVIDSGVDAAHPDLQGQVLKGLDLVDDKGDGDTDLVGHGTTVAAIIAGKDDTGGVIGIAPRAKILPVRVLDQDNRYDDAMIVAQGVRWAVDNGARVINLSLGGSGSSAALAAAIDYAFARDVVVVACTGNASASSSTGVWYPAREPGVIAVAGMERDGDVLWSGSITGKETVVTAPATQLVGARPPTDRSDAEESGYWRVQGTSFAAPMVTATAALIRSRWPDMPASEVVNRIIKTAKDRGPAGRDNKYGYGLIDPTLALTAELPAVSLNPLDTNASPGVSGLGSAPSDGQAQSAPDFLRPGAAADRAPGSNAGAAVAAPKPDPHANYGWWIAASLFLLSGAVGVVVFRRFSSVH